MRAAGRENLIRAPEFLMMFGDPIRAVIKQYYKTLNLEPKNCRIFRVFFEKKRRASTVGKFRNLNTRRGYNFAFFPFFPLLAHRFSNIFPRALWGFFFSKNLRELRTVLAQHQKSALKGI